MYAVEDATFRRARSIVAALARELTSQDESGSPHAVDLRELVRQSAEGDLPQNGEGEYISSVAADLARLFPIEELFPRKRRARDA